MMLAADDRFVLMELISLHGHLVDAGELDRMDEVFTDDVVYDVSDFAGTVIEGVAALRDAGLALGQSNPVGNRVTNIVLTPRSADEVEARSKGIGINADGTCGSLTYLDTIVRTDVGWRISRRKVIAHRVPLGGTTG